MGLFSKKAKQERTPNPYLNARREWNSYAGAILSSRQAWMCFALLSLLICLAAVGGMVHIGSQSKFVPYVIEVDRLGQAVAVGTADKAAPVDPRVVHASLAAWVNHARMVTPDMAVQRKAIFAVYAHLDSNDPAMARMNDWMNGTAESSPFVRAEKFVVDTEISSVLPQSDETWQVEWVENLRDRKGILQQSFRMRALITVYISPPDIDTTIEQIRQNPLGIYVRDFSWSKQL